MKQIISLKVKTVSCCGNSYIIKRNQKEPIHCKTCRTVFDREGRRVLQNKDGLLSLIV